MLKRIEYSKIDKSKLIEAVADFKKIKIMVIGDYMLDEYLWGNVDRVSPEAPVPVVLEKKRSVTGGGAANVVLNIKKLGADVFPVGIIGDDRAGSILKNIFGEHGIDTSGLIEIPERPTTLKQRIMAHGQQLLRVDNEQTDIVRSHEILRDSINNIAGNCDAVIISDYGKGVVNPELIKILKELKDSNGTIISVDPKVGHFFEYKELSLITPNNKEAGQASGMKVEDEKGIVEAGTKIIEKLGCELLLITWGSKGMVLFNRNGDMVHIPARARNVFDVTGAGDTVISVATVALASGLNSTMAVVLSNIAAGIVVGLVGTSHIDPAQLLEEINDA